MQLFCVACLDSTLVDKSGRSCCKCDRMRRPNSSSAGDIPVVVCGVVLYRIETTI